jgi:hypothetical protein
VSAATASPCSSTGHHTSTRSLSPANTNVRLRRLHGGKCRHPFDEGQRSRRTLPERELPGAASDCGSGHKQGLCSIPTKAVADNRPVQPLQASGSGEQHQFGLDRCRVPLRRAVASHGADARDRTPAFPFAWMAVRDASGPPTRGWAHRLSSGAGRASGRSLAGGQHAQSAGEAERDQHARDDAEPLLARRGELLERRIADACDSRRRPPQPPLHTSRSAFQVCESNRRRPRRRMTPHTPVQPMLYEV